MNKEIDCKKCFGDGYLEEYEILESKLGVAHSINPTHLVKCDECNETGKITLEVK